MTKTSLQGPSCFHNLEPDYTKTIFKLASKIKNKILDILIFLYGERRSKKHIKEIERLLGVYYAHKCEDMIEWEKEFTPEQRFSEKDVILITYGDLISDSNKKPLQVLEELSENSRNGLSSKINLSADEIESWKTISKNLNIPLSYNVFVKLQPLA